MKRLAHQTQKKLKTYSYITGSFSRKIVLFTLSGLLLGLFASIFLSNMGLLKLKNQAIQEFEVRLESHTRNTYADYLDQLTKSFNQHLDSIVHEQQILRQIVQTHFDNRDDLRPLNDIYSLLPLYKDHMRFNGKYQQNDKSEQSVVLAQGYLLNPDGSLKPEAAEIIKDTVFMDTLLPAFLKTGIAKKQVYFTGNREANVYRVSPWMDLGGALDQVYPKHNTSPNWEAFYPGLFDAWETKVQNKEVADGMKIDEPIFMEATQDGATGEMIISIKSGIWNVDRTMLLGTISYDVSIDQLIDRVESLKITRNSFSFLGQSNGNIFAVNDKGLEILGISANSVLTPGLKDSFNRLDRSFADSRFPEVRRITFPTSLETRLQKIVIENTAYLLIIKRLDPINSWSPATGFREEEWVTGVVIPESDFMDPYVNVVENINNSTKDILLRQIVVILVLFAFISTGLFLIYDRLSINLNILLQATEQLKRKNYNIHIDVPGDDEFSKLAQAYNGMIAEIKNTFHQLTAQNEVLKNEMLEKNKRDEQIAYMKQYDALTGLPNKQNIYKKLDEFIQRSLTENKLGAFVIIGIDDFKKINEGFGIEIGDDLLKQVAERLRSSSGADVIARITGDEFGLIFYKLSALDDLIPKLDHLKTLLNRKYVLNARELFITASCGISSFPIDSTQSKEIVKFASATLIHSKETSKDNYKFYDVNIESNIKSKIEMINELRQSIMKDELSVYYQPIIDYQTKELRGMEALTRWKNSKFGFIPPTIFIPLAEEIQFITQIEKWVLERSLRDLKEMKENGISNCYVSVNLSAIDLDSDTFMDYVEEQVSKGDLMPGDIQLEITEGILINNYDTLIPKLAQLSRMGVKIALDDFGTGYSSLKYIKKLPIHTIKIDRSFVKDYPKYDDGSIAKIIVNLAQNLNMTVIAEGVETSVQADFLSELNCTLHQGYLYNRPLTLDGLIEAYGTTQVPE